MSELRTQIAREVERLAGPCSQGQFDALTASQQRPFLYIADRILALPEIAEAIEWRAAIYQWLSDDIDLGFEVRFRRNEKGEIEYQAYDGSFLGRKPKLGHYINPPE